jgi:uncharacterized protein (DUF1501 family)
MSGKNRKIVMVQLSGGNDYLNCIVPFTDPKYVDNRPNVRTELEDILRLDDEYGMIPSMAPVKDLFDDGKMAIIHGVGYPTPNRSHFRSMDIWHTAEPDKLGDQGWLGQALREMDPNGENVVGAVNFGAGLPRALVSKGAPVASVTDLETYGLLNDVDGTDQRAEALELFANMYKQAIGSGPVMDFLSRTGLDALKGADILRTAPEKYSSDIEYGNNSFAKAMKGAAQVLTADIGTRIVYTQHGSFDVHTNGVALQASLWTDVAAGINDLYSDLKAQNAAADVLMFVFSEFGRRVRDNGNGTDHGSGGVAFMIGDSVKGGHYGEYPSLDADKLIEGDLAFNNDFRGLYAEVLEDWLEIDAKPIVNGTFEKMNFLKKAV